MGIILKTKTRCSPRWYRNIWRKQERWTINEMIIDCGWNTMDEMVNHLYELRRYTGPVSSTGVVIKKIRRGRNYLAYSFIDAGQPGISLFVELQAVEDERKMPTLFDVSQY